MVSPPHPSREKYYQVLAGALPTDSLVVTALGNASYLWAVVRDSAKNFYLEDAMGLALPVALGLAVAQPTREIVVVEGDGGFLMHMGGLVTVAAAISASMAAIWRSMLSGVRLRPRRGAFCSRALRYSRTPATSAFSVLVIFGRVIVRISFSRFIFQMAD